MPVERAARAAREAGRAPSGPALRPDRAGARPAAAHLAGVGLLTVAAAAGYSVVALARYYTFQTASYDLVIFDQAVRSYAHLRPGISVIKGLHNGFGPDFSVLGDHFSPVLALLAPLYWVSDSPANLLVAQAVLFALAIPPLWLFTRRAFGGGRKAAVAAYLVAASYALSWPIASAVGFDFHEVAFAPVLTAVALERLQAGCAPDCSPWPACCWSRRTWASWSPGSGCTWRWPARARCRGSRAPGWCWSRSASVTACWPPMC